MSLGEGKEEKGREDAEVKFSNFIRGEAQR